MDQTRPKISSSFSFSIGIDTNQNERIRGAIKSGCPHVAQPSRLRVLAPSRCQFFVQVSSLRRDAAPTRSRDGCATPVSFDSFSRSPSFNHARALGLINTSIDTAQNRAKLKPT